MQGELEERTIFQWKLKEFPSLCENRVDRSYFSPEFRFCGRNWMLYLYPNGLSRSPSEGFITLDLVVLTAEPPRDVRYSVGIRKPKGEREVYEGGTTDFKCVPGVVSASFTRIRVMSRSKLLRRRDEFLVQDILTLTLELKLDDRSFETVLKNASVQATVERNVADVSVQAAVAEILSCGGKGEPSEKTGVDKIVEDIAKLWPNSDHTDVLLKVKNTEFKAHRTILAARAPALGAMFHHDTTEKASGEVSIDDCEPEIFEQLLHYIYKGAPRELTTKNASALYILADKYLVSEVKVLCLQCMLDTLCVDTFCDTLMLSLMYREAELLKKVTDFFSRNMIDVLKTVEWQRFMGEHKTWANEIMIRATELTAARYEMEKRALLYKSVL